MAKEINELGWKYDPERQEWYTLETVAYANDNFSIKKEEDGDQRPYLLFANNKHIARCKKLATAKLIAHHLHFG